MARAAKLNSGVWRMSDPTALSRVLHTIRCIHQRYKVHNNPYLYSESLEVYPASVQFFSFLWRWLRGLTGWPVDCWQPSARLELFRCRRRHGLQHSHWSARTTKDVDVNSRRSRRVGSILSLPLFITCQYRAMHLTVCVEKSGESDA